VTIVDPTKANRQPQPVMVVGHSSFSPSALASLIRAAKLARRIDAVKAKDSHCSAKALIVNQLGEFLVLIPNDGDYADLPGGRIHDGEDAVTALAREVREETKLSIGDIKLAETVAFVDFSGVPRTTLLYRATALTNDVQLSDEHKDFRWVKPSELAGYRLNYLAGPVQRTLDPATISAAEAGHPFYGNQYSIIGVVNNGSVVSKKLKDGDSHEHGDNRSFLGYTAASRRWKLAGKKVIWTNEPDDNEKSSVEDHLSRKHNIENIVHFMHGFSSPISAVEATGRFMTEAELLNHPSHHETARRSAEKIYQAAADDWLAKLNADFMAALFGHKGMDYDGVWLDVYGAAAGGWVATMQQAASKAYATTARTLGHDAGVDHQPSEEALKDFASTRAAVLERFPGAVRDKVAASLKRGLANNEDARALARRAAEDFDQIQTGAARRVAATEAQVVYGKSQSEVLAAAGYSRKRWVTVGDDRVRDSHYLCESQGAIPASESFHNGLMFPGDPNGDISEVANCRCNLEGAP